MSCGLSPCESPHSHRCRGLALGVKAQYIAAHCSLANIDIVHDKNRRIRGAGNQRNGLARINKAGTGCILHDRGVIDDCVTKEGAAVGRAAWAYPGR